MASTSEAGWLFLCCLAAALIAGKTAEAQPPCPSSILCRTYCDFGFATDENGCETCACLDPCATKDCGNGECSAKVVKCESDSDGCMDGTRTEVTCIAQASSRISCPANACERKCMNGYRKNANGCETCNCIGDVCPNINCILDCENGLEKDENGCDICKCSQSINQCSELLCDLHCKNGFQKDKNNCDTCQCAEPECTDLKCLLYCENGFLQDDNGCDICKCAPAPCEPVRCLVYCEYGWAKNDNGCEVCECYDPCSEVECKTGQVCMATKIPCEADACEADYTIQTSCQFKAAEACNLPLDPLSRCRASMQRWFYNSSSMQCEEFMYGGCGGNANNFEALSTCQEQCIAPVECPEVMCMMFCETGFMKDANGCDMCKCNEPVDECYEVMCAMFCENGFKKDENGCDICQCAEPECPEVMCMMYCEHGFLQDDNGCDICKCAPAPCEPVRCRMYCEYGWAKNDNGCEVCECYDPCSEVECKTGQVCMATKIPCEADACEADYTIKTACQCKKFSCSMSCEYGFSYDINGCELCQCFNPCSTKDCNTDQTCFTKKSSCKGQSCQQDLSNIAFCKETASLSAVVVDLTLDGDFNQIPDQILFKEMITFQLSSYLKIPRGNIVVTRVVAGSIIIALELVPSASVPVEEILTAWNRLRDQLYSDAVVFTWNGKDSFKKSTVIASDHDYIFMEITEPTEVPPKNAGLSRREMVIAIAVPVICLVLILFATITVCCRSDKSDKSGKASGAFDHDDLIKASPSESPRSSEHDLGLHNAGFSARSVSVDMSDAHSTSSSNNSPSTSCNNLESGVGYSNMYESKIKEDHHPNILY